MSNTQKKLTIIGFIAISFASVAQMVDLAIIPAADSIFTAFDDAPMAILNFILSGPQLLIVLSAVLSTFLMKKFNKRTLLVVSFTLLTFATCLGAIVDNVYYIALMRGLAGFFGGFCAPVSIAYIGETFYDDEEKNSMYIGLFSSVSAVFGLVFSLIGGVLCVRGWQNTFKTYWILIPMLIMIVTCLPKGGAMSPVGEVSDQVDKSEKIPVGKVSLVCLAAFIASVIMNVIIYLISVIIAERGIGNSDFSGVLSGIVTLLTAVICALFGSVYKRLRYYTGAFMFLLVSVGFLVMNFASGKALAVLSASIMGIAYGFLVSYYSVSIFNIVPQSRIAETAPYVTAVIGLGAFASTYFAYALMGIIGSEQVSSTFIILAIMSAVCALISAVISASWNRGRV